jgi:hypothetical protein
MERRGKTVSTSEPKPDVPFNWCLYQEFQASASYDFICLAKSPSFTPLEADVIYDEIKTRLISEI